MENIENSQNQETVQPANPTGKIQLPNSTAILVLGILSIALCWCYGLPGIILGIVALVLSGKANKIYKENPEAYTETSYKNLKAGKTCSIIGLCISALYLIIVVIYIAIIGVALTTAPWNLLNNY